MQHYVITTDGAVRSYKSAVIAAAMAVQLASQGAVTATDDNVKNVPSAVLVTLHNLIRPEKPIKKFADRETAEKRLKGVLEVLAKPGEAPTAVEGTAVPQTALTTASEDPMATKKGRAAKKTPRTTTPGEGAGRPSAFAGKVIRKIATENPRREGSHGYNSWEVIKNGMSYEKYIEAGGRRTDLDWDLKHGFVKLEKA